jgi:hypothetical protein
MQARKRAIGSLLPACIAFACFATGCDTTNGSGFTSVDAPSVKPAVQPSDKQAAEQVVNQFVSDVNAKDYPSAVKLMSPSLSRKLPAPALANSMNGEMRPFAGASNLAFDAVDYSGRDKNLVARVSFKGADGILYHTNFVVTSGKQIDMLLPPSKPGTPVAGGSLKPAKPHG